MPNANAFVNSGGMGDSWRARMRWVVDEFGGGRESALAKTINKRVPDARVRRQNIEAWVREKKPSAPSGPMLEAILRAFPEINPEYLLTGRGAKRRRVDGQPDAYIKGVDAATRAIIQGAMKMREDAGLSPLPVGADVSPEKSLEVLRLAEEAEEAREHRSDHESGEEYQGRGRARGKRGAAGSGGEG